MCTSVAPIPHKLQSERRAMKLKSVIKIVFRDSLRNISLFQLIYRFTTKIFQLLVSGGPGRERAPVGATSLPPLMIVVI